MVFSNLTRVRANVPSKMQHSEVKQRIKTYCERQGNIGEILWNIKSIQQRTLVYLLTDKE